MQLNNETYFVGKDVAEALGYERATKAIQDHVDSESNVQNAYGSVRITKTTKVTGKGQIYFVNKFLQGEY